MRAVDPPGARQLEQVLEEPAHAVGRHPDPAEVRLEPVEVPRPGVALDVAEESADRHQGALEIVGHDVGEALELGAARLELAIRLRQALPLGARLGRPAHDLGDEQVHRHRGDHEDDRGVHERQPAEAARPRRLQGADRLEASDDHRREDAQGRRGDEQPAIELEGGHQDDHRVEERGPVVDALAEDEQGVNGGQQRREARQGSRPDPAPAQEPQGDETEAAQAGEGQGVARLSAEEVGGGAEGRPHEPRYQGHAEVGCHARRVRQRREHLHGAEHTRPGLVEGLAPGG